MSKGDLFSMANPGLGVFSCMALKVNLTHIDLRTKTHNKSQITYIIGCVDN